MSARGESLGKRLAALALGCLACAGALGEDRPGLAPDPGAVARMALQNRMALCSRDAARKGLKGAERREFLSDCLSGDSSVGASSRQPAPAASARHGGPSAPAGRGVATGR
jgi:hypothetical protein